MFADYITTVLFLCLLLFCIGARVCVCVSQITFSAVGAEIIEYLPNVITGHHKHTTVCVSVFAKTT